MKSNSFTLLEVLCALVILTLGLSLLLWQLGLSLQRADRNRITWERTHDLTQAAEFLLIHGPEEALDETLFSGEYELRCVTGESEWASAEKLPVGWNLHRQTIELWQEGELLDELTFDRLNREPGYAR